MDFLQLIVNFMSAGVVVIGASMAIPGFIDWGEGRSQQNAGKTQEGMSKMVGGGFVIIVGLFLVPEIMTLFNI